MVLFKKANHNKLELITGIEPVLPACTERSSIELISLVKLQISDTGPPTFPQDIRYLASETIKNQSC